MSRILSKLELSSDFLYINGLVPVTDKLPKNINIAEKRIIDDSLKISKNIDFIFFRRFIKDDVRTSQAVAYVIDNSKKKLSDNDLAKLHHTLWLNGTVPLIYIDNNDKVDILSCVSKAVSNKAKGWHYHPLDTISTDAHNINELINRFSALRLANGTFWEDERNNIYIDIKKSSHNVLLEKVKEADREIEGEKKPVARRLLLITLLVKYLEDRGVFKTEKDFFSRIVKGANTFYNALEKGTIEEIKRLLHKLEIKFNGDIFILTRNKSDKITQGLIKKIVNIVRADIDQDNQLYFWDLYNFEHIPVEVISHIYQYFTGKQKGAVFTPMILVNLMLDQVMPLENINGDEKIFDPTCGSGIFLVSALRRLIYINNKKKKDWLNPKNIIELLKKTMFGVELSPEAAYITSFSLALAVCDALQPDIIWRELKFEKTINRNIFIGDFGEVGKNVLKASKSDGFDIILGNPPFMEELTYAIKEELNKSNRTIPANQIAYYVIETCMSKYLSETGRICMIQPYGFLYNALTANMRSNFLEKYSVELILDFISINGLFYNASTKAIAIIANKSNPDNNHKILHLTFRRTKTVNEKIFFELDHYDYHTVTQKKAIDIEYSWKANLLGGGRLVHLTKKIKELPTIQSYITQKKWLAREGYILGEKKENKDNKLLKKDERKTATWLYNQPLLVPKAITSTGINKKYLDTVKSKNFVCPRSKDIYNAPLMIISEMETLNSALWFDGFLAYTHEYTGIAVKKHEKEELKHFYSLFIKNREILQSCLQLCGGRTLTARATATQKKDIMALPFPDNGNFDLVPWEIELLDDIRNYMADYVRLGQDSELLSKKATSQDIKNYTETFLRLMNKTYSKLIKCKELENNDFRLIAFSFSGDINALNELDNTEWLEKLSPLMEKEQSDVLRTKRVIKIFTGDTLIIVKPNKLRYWIRSTAIRDVDDVIVAIFKGEK